MKKQRIGLALTGLIIALILTLLLTACPPSIANNPSTDGNQNSNGAGGGGAITEADILSAFGLHRGVQSAYEAAQKIKTATPTQAGLTFTECTIVAYDDQAGSFTVYLKGSKNGSNFDKPFTITGFTHPYAGATPQSMATLSNQRKLLLDNAIKENKKLSDFISASNAVKGAGFVSFEIRLSNGKNVKVGKYPAYDITVQLEEKPGKKVKMTGDFKIKYKKLIAGGSPTESYGSTYSLNPHLQEEAYFTEKDVFNYITKAIKDNVIKVDGEKFASEFYAKAIFLNSAVAGIFNYDKFDEYKTLYENAGGSGELTINNLGIGIHNTRNGGIKADDYAGKLTVDYYVQTADKITADNPDGVLPIKAEKTGFQTVSAELLKANFFLTKTGNKNLAKTNWLAKNIPLRSLLREDESKKGDNSGGWYKLEDIPALKNPLSPTVNTWYLTVNGKPTMAESLAESVESLSLITDLSNRECQILITSIQVKKVNNEKKLELIFDFEGVGDPITISIEPFPLHLWE